MDYTERMRDLLAQRGMTQAELAAKSKTNSAYYVNGGGHIVYIMKWIQYTKSNPL